MAAFFFSISLPRSFVVLNESFDFVEHFVVKTHTYAVMHLVCQHRTYTCARASSLSHIHTYARPNAHTGHSVSKSTGIKHIYYFRFLFIYLFSRSASLPSLCSWLLFWFGRIRALAFVVLVHIQIFIVFFSVYVGVAAFFFLNCSSAPNATTNEKKNTHKIKRELRMLFVLCIVHTERGNNLLRLWLILFLNV